MGEAATLLIAVLMFAAGPIAEELDPDPSTSLAASLEEPGVDVEADATASDSEGQRPADGEAGSQLDHEASAEADLDDAAEVDVEARTGSIQAHVGVSARSMNVQLAEGQILELTFTPRDSIDLVDHAAATLEGPGAEEPEPADQVQASAPGDEEEGNAVSIAWTLAPVAGLATAAAAGHVTPLGRWLRRLLGIAPTVPMFSRIPRDEVLDHESREAIYELLQREAGLSLETICEETDLSRSTARHHVHQLEEANMIEHTMIGRSRVHYLVGQRDQALCSHLLANGTRKAVYEVVEAQPSTITEIAGETGANPGSVHFHLRKLLEAGLVERANGDDKRYRATSGQAVESENARVGAEAVE